jgi:hypothetical protein
MTSDDKKAKANPAHKNEAASKDKNASGVSSPKPEGIKTEGIKTESGEIAAAPPASPNYSRGEGQKPVSQAYKDNWNAIFANKKKKR